MLRFIPHRAPYFSISSADSWAFDVLAEEGITIDASLFPIWIPGRGDVHAPRLPYEVRRGLLAWPMTSLPLRVGMLSIGSWPFLGGSYMRLLPLMLLRWATLHRRSARRSRRHLRTPLRVR